MPNITAPSKLPKGKDGGKMRVRFVEIEVCSVKHGLNRRFMA
jgi:hypothetical protein